MDSDNSDNSSSSCRKPLSTVNCLLCGGTQIYPGPRYTNHLTNEHGVVFDINYLVQISLLKRDKGGLPKLNDLPVLKPDDESLKPAYVQTEPSQKTLCSKCSDPISDSSEDDNESDQGGEENDSSESDGQISCWSCGLCSKVFKKSAHLKAHSLEAHKSEVSSEARPIRIPEEEFYQRKDGVPIVYYSCYFCKERFRGDHRLKRHLYSKHENETFADMEKALEELRLVRDSRKKTLKCGYCGSGSVTEVDFDHHLSSVHNVSRIQHDDEHRSSSSFSQQKKFRCELCCEEVQHDREIISLHMKNVHLISWTEYQEILLKTRREDGADGSSETFDCVVCGEVRLKNKREHLRKKHQMSQEIYDKLIGNRKSPAKKCLLCEKETLDLKRHLERIHRVGYEAYEELTSDSKDDDESLTNGGTGILRCRYGCEETFKKEYQLYLHLRLKHGNGERDEEDDEEEEEDNTRNSGKSSRSMEETFKCSLCPKRFHDKQSLLSHISSKHDMSWKEYQSQTTMVTASITPVTSTTAAMPKATITPSNNNSVGGGGAFECKLCNRIFKYDRTAINDHLQTAHAINWSGYLDRIRVKAECKICETNVKNLKEHLATVHKLTEKEYEAGEADKGDAPSQSNQNISDFLAVEVNLPKPPKSDIQNKTNKNCSSCTITFASRRNFIEHCTTVHNMKFKTKSGLTIQAPRTSNAGVPTVVRKPVVTVSHQLTPSVTIKRKSDSVTTTFSPANFGSNSSILKKPRIDPTDMASIIPQLPQHPLPQATIEPVEKTLGSHYQTTGVSRWNQCKYQCCFCKKTTQSRSSMTSHIANTHGIPIKEYKERNYPDIEVVTNWFQCRLCSTKTKFVKDCISPHLKMSHSIDIEDYERQYMRPEDWPNHQKPPGGTKSEMRNSVGGDTSRSLLKPSFQYSPSQPPEDESEKKKWNRCRFQCKICQLITIDARQMRVHISNVHKLSNDVYFSQYGSSEIVTKKFRCELCGSEMKFCRQNIYAHMKDCHKLTLMEYEAKVGYTPPPDDDDYDEPEHIVINNDVVTTKPYNEPENEDEAPTIPIPPSHPPVDHFTSKWNKCRYQCQICQRLTSEKPVIRDHIMKQHGLNLDDYEAQYGDVEVITEYFTCGICRAEVKHCHRNISLHLQKVHNMTTSEYEESQYLDDSGKEDINNGEIGFGGHFLLDNNSSDSSSPTRRASNGPAIRPPPREDVINPKNKFCLPCNRDFNRRQAFVEHCRNVHRMKINFTRDPIKTEVDDFHLQQQQYPQPQQQQTASFTPGSLDCDYCGKQFSNRSNRNRHMLLSCEVVKSGGASNKNSQQSLGDSSMFEDGSEVKCPITDCEMIFGDSNSLRSHLYESHEGDVKIDADDEDEEGSLKIDESSIKRSSEDVRHVGNESLTEKSSDEAIEVKVEFQAEEEVFMDTSGENHDEPKDNPSSPSGEKPSKDEDEEYSDDESDSDSDDDSDDSDSDSDSDDDDDEQKTQESDH